MQCKKKSEHYVLLYLLQNRFFRLAPILGRSGYLQFGLLSKFGIMLGRGIKDIIMIIIVGIRKFVHSRLKL